MKLPCSEAHENQEVDLLYVHERENSVLESGEKHMAEVAPPLRPETLMMQNSDTLYTARVLTKKDSWYIAIEGYSYGIQVQFLKYWYDFSAHVASERIDMGLDIKRIAMLNCVQ